MFRAIMNYVLHKENRFAINTTIGINKLLSDSHFLEKIFKLTLGYDLDLDNPVTFNQKLQWLKLNDRRDVYSSLVDKAEVKGLVASSIGSKYIIPTIGVYDSFDDINFASLPSRFVIKCTHDSGGLVICRNKETLNKHNAKEKISASLKRNYFWSGREWPYKNVKPRIIVEQYIEDPIHHDLMDYKLFCFNGTVRYIQVDYDRFVDHKRSFYSPEWEYQPFTTRYPTDPEHVIDKPANLDEMITYAEKLAKGIGTPPFVRIDLYNVNGRVYFGEITMYHGSGLENFNPQEWDKKLGEMIDISELQIKSSHATEA